MVAEIRTEQLNMIQTTETKGHHVPTGGLEPPIFGLGDRRLIH
jgi:hypothetical protein